MPSDPMFDTYTLQYSSLDTRPMGWYIGIVHSFVFFVWVSVLG